MLKANDIQESCAIAKKMTARCALYK